MKKIIFVISFLLIAVNVFATDYYGGAAGKNINADDLWYEAVSGSCSGSGSPVASATVLQEGNTLYANGCTIAINTSFTATEITNKLGGAANAVAGGGYTIAGAATVTSNVVASDTNNTAVITASAGSYTIEVVGNITAGAGRGLVGAANNTINVTGNVTAAAEIGVYNNNAGAVNITGNVTGGSVIQKHGLHTAYGGGTVTGTVTGGAAVGAAGVNCTGTTGMTLTGNLVNTATANASQGKIIYSPASPANYIQYGATKYYYDIPDAASVLSSDTVAGESGTYDEAARNTDPGEENVRSGTTYKIQNSEKTGSMSAGGGGGAWGF